MERSGRALALAVTIQIVGIVTTVLDFWLYNFGCRSAFKGVLVHDSVFRYFVVYVRVYWSLKSALRALLGSLLAL